MQFLRCGSFVVIPRSARLHESPKRGIMEGMNILLQIGLVVGICLTGECISAALPFILPGNIISMMLVLILLLVKLLKIDRIRQTAQFLRQNMAFFLVPSSVSIIQNLGLLGEILVPLLVVCMVSTILTFLTTSLAVSLTIRLIQKNKGKTGDSTGKGHE